MAYNSLFHKTLTKILSTTKADIKNLELKILQMETRLVRKMFAMLIASTLLYVSMMSLILHLFLSG